MKTFLKKCKWGEFLLLSGDMVSQYADLYGEWCEAEVSLFGNLLDENSNVVEVGSHIGLHSVPLSKLSEKGRIICFEPQRILYQMLCANCAINGRTNVYPLNCAVGDRTARIDIQSTDYLTPWNYGAFSIDIGFDAEKPFDGKKWTESADIVKLDDVPVIQDLDGLDLLKIDAEGQEINVLQGAHGLITKHRPALFVENNNEARGDALIETIRNLGYRCYWHCAKRFRPQNYNKASQKMPGADFNMACFPRERDAAPRGLSEAKEFSDLKKGDLMWVECDA